MEAVINVISEADNKNVTIGFELKELILNIYNLLPSSEQRHLFEELGWTDGILEKAVELLSKECYRDNQLHNHREKILQNIKEREIEYYADKISRMVESLFKTTKDYHKLLSHHLRCMEQYGKQQCDCIPERSPEINFALINKIEEIIRTALKEKIKENLKEE